MSSKKLTHKYARPACLHCRNDYDWIDAVNFTWTGSDGWHQCRYCYRMNDVTLGPHGFLSQLGYFILFLIMSYIFYLIAGWILAGSLSEAPMVSDREAYARSRNGQLYSKVYESQWASILAGTVLFLPIMFAGYFAARSIRNL